jgi:1,4-alpha-glucan branching enzyme
MEDLHLQSWPNEVQAYLISSALLVDQYHVDGLR